MLVFSEVRPTNPLTSGAVCAIWAAKRFTLLSFVLLIITHFQFDHRTVRAQTQEPASDDDIVRVSTDLLLFPVRIRDKKGQSVPGLTEASVSLRDPDKVTTSLYFLPGAEHVALLFALDRSGSLREIISQQQDAALALFGRFSQRSSVAVLRFAERPLLAAPFDKDTAAARTAFSFSSATDQHTAIFDAARAAINTFDSLPRNRAQRRIVILISDGLDNASTTKPSVVIEAAIDKSVSFYVIHLPLFEPRNGRLAVRIPAKGFRELGEKTGGKYFLVGDATAALAPKNSGDLTPVFQAIEEDLKSQYLLGFYISGAAHDGRRHEFSLSLVPPGIEYSTGRLDYSRTHKFFVNLPRGARQIPN